MSIIYSINNDPLTCAVSLMGRANSERIYRDRIIRPKVSPKRSLKSLPEPRRSTRRNSPGGVTRGMDLLRGVYTLTQVKKLCAFELNNYVLFMLSVVPNFMQEFPVRADRIYSLSLYSLPSN